MIFAPMASRVTPFEGSRKPDGQTRPLPKGALRFITSNLPGWSKSGEFRDERPERLHQIQR